MGSEYREAGFLKDLDLTRYDGWNLLGCPSVCQEHTYAPPQAQCSSSPAAKMDRGPNPEFVHLTGDWV